jgi:hypothetical protein
MAPGTLNEREKGREERSESARAREGEFNLAVEDWWWIVRDMRRRRRRRAEDEEEEGGGGHTLARLFRQAICRNGVEGNRGRVNDLEGQGRV